MPESILFTKIHRAIPWRPLASESLEATRFIARSHLISNAIIGKLI